MMAGSCRQGLGLLQETRGNAAEVLSSETTVWLVHPEIRAGGKIVLGTLVLGGGGICALPLKRLGQLFGFCCSLYACFSFSSHHPRPNITPLCYVFCLIMFLLPHTLGLLLTSAGSRLFMVLPTASQPLCKQPETLCISPFKVLSVRI